MQFSSRFTIALHIFICIDTFEKDHKITSEYLAKSVNVNAVVIRNIIAQLKAAGLVITQRGTGGTTITKPLEEISFFEVYQAVESVDDGGLFRFHEQPNPDCPVGRNIHHVLDDRLDETQKALESKLKTFTLKDVVKETKHLIEQEEMTSN
ncbi:MAG: Rrf2 family transcriptional regulator [Enterococcus viikkiensis]